MEDCVTTTELEQEHDYRVSERLGIMCGTDEPTESQKQIAEKEADEAITILGIMEDGE